MAEPIPGSVENLITQALDRVEQPDSNLIVAEVLKHVSNDDYHRLAEVGLKERVTTRLSKARYRPAPSLPARPSGRWANVVEAQSSGELDLSRYAVYTGRSRKWLADCTVPDLVGAADFNRERGERYTEMSENFSKLANYLKGQKDAEVVGDLVNSKVAKLLSA